VRLRPELYWPYVIFILVVFFLMCGGIVYFATFGSLAGGDTVANLLTRIGMDALCLFTMASLLIQFRNDSQLELDDDGISKPTLFGIRTLRWSEIREVRFNGPEIRLLSADSRIVIHPFVYADRYAFMPEIGRRLRHLLPEQPTLSEQPPSAAEEMGQGRLRRLLSTVTLPRNLASYGHLAAVFFYVLVLRTDPLGLGLGRRWLGAGIALAFAAHYASRQLWKRASGRIAAPVEVTWAAVVAAAVLTSPTSWSARQQSAVAFCTVFVGLLVLHLLFEWYRMAISAAIKTRREAAAAVHAARK